MFKNLNGVLLRRNKYNTRTTREILANVSDTQAALTGVFLSHLHVDMRGVAVMSLGVSTKLLYVGPG